MKVTFCLAGQPGAETGAESVCPGRVIKQTACQPKQIFRFRGEASWKGKLHFYYKIIHTERGKQNFIKNALCVKY